jgi:predicted NBD/HSP70 family sugar kinase
VVGQLLDEGLVAEDAVEGAGQRVGRPSTGIRIRTGARYVIGVQVGAGTVQLGVCDLRAQVGPGASFTFDVAAERPERVVARIAEAAAELAADVPADRLLGIGVAAPGPVDPGHRRILVSVNLGWRDVPFADLLEAALDVSTVVDHNVRAMALAESRYGETAGADPLLYVYVRTGVGAGLVIGGYPFRPGAYGVTELGHLRVLEKGPPCACGATGCLETVVSEPYLIERLGRRSDNPLADIPEGLLDDLVDHLTTGLASAVNLLNPELILLGGIFAPAPEAVFDRVRAALRAKAFPVLRDVVRVERPTVGGDSAGVVGGAAIALDCFLYER